jgi:serine/threonine protein kinase
MQPEADTRVLAGARREPAIESVARDREATLTTRGHVPLVAPLQSGVGQAGVGPRVSSTVQRAGDNPSQPPAAERGPDSGPLALRRWVGRYELIHRLAHGGMATVYLGRAKGKAGFEKVVAVKVIHPHLASEAEFVGMFLDEARIAARIHHPHVVEILDLGESEGGYYMVMEFIEGENLAALVRALASSPPRGVPSEMAPPRGVPSEMAPSRGVLPIGVILQILSDTLEGLVAAHELRDIDGQPYQLVHRDVSPHNILINLDGWAKVGDFGIMKAAGKASNTKTGELRGKLAYMSPEQARGGQVDLRTDLFAVGVIGWELLTGRRLFACTTEAATLEKVIACEVPRLDPIEHERPELDEATELRAGLDALLAKALAARPEDRFADAKSMLADVRRLRRLAFDLGGDATRMEPRKHLGGLMTRYFQTRVDYARVALRRTGEYEALVGAVAAESAERWGIEPTLQVERPTTGSNPTVSERTRTPTPTADAITPTLATVTGSNPSIIVQAPAGNRLVQWLLLPMLGAAIALLVMPLLDRGKDESVEPRDAERVEPPPAEPSKNLPSRAATEYQVPPRRADIVNWCFNTTPSGAQVSVAGVVQTKPTPSCVTVPAGDEPVAVELSLAGHEPLRLDLTPVANQNFPEKLTPLPVEQPSRDRARTRKSGANKPAGDPDTSEDPKDTRFLPVPDSLLDGDGG